jgi:hypothetical protein
LQAWVDYLERLRDGIVALDKPRTGTDRI